MASWCFKPTSLATLSLVNSRSGRLEMFPASWPAEPGSYELMSKIGAGGSASVYRAQCKQLQMTVAVKRLDLDSSNDLASLIREATLLRRFQHQHVLLLYTSFVVGRELWLVMPYMDLGSVRTIMRRGFPQGLDEVLIATIMQSVLHGLDYVHKNGGIHRDIKADNILISSRGEVRLADFGVASDQARNLSVVLSRVLRSSSTSSIGSSCSCGSSGAGGGARQRSPAAALASLRASTFVGTPCWMAPEVMQQLDEGYGNAADIWSVGITLIELATGMPPLARCHPVRVVVDTLNLPPPSLPASGTDGRRFSKAFRDLVEQCLQKDPSRRPSAAELLQHRFFRAAREDGHLAAALLPALLSPPAGGARAAAAAPAGRAPSAPAAAGVGPGRLLSGVLGEAGARRHVHSEPLLARLWSVLGRAPAGPSMHGPHAAGAGGPQGAGPARLASRWQFPGTAAASAVGGSFRLCSMMTAPKAAGSAMAAAVNGGGSGAAAAPGSLARAGLAPVAANGF